MGSEQGGNGPARRERVYGWVLSLALHGSLAGLVLLGWGEVVPLVGNEPFVWEVSLVGAPLTGLSRTPSRTLQPRVPTERAAQHRSLAAPPLKAHTVGPKPEPTESPPAPAERDSPQLAENSTDGPVVEQVAAPPAAIQARYGAGSGPDYDWLKKLLRHSLEQVKRYPDHALAQGWQGRVLLEIAIEETGRIVDVVVAEIGRAHV